MGGESVCSKGCPRIKTRWSALFISEARVGLRNFIRTHSLLNHKKIESWTQWRCRRFQFEEWEWVNVLERPLFPPPRALPRWPTPLRVRLISIFFWRKDSILTPFLRW